MPDKKQIWPVLFLILAFAMLWFPLGQHDFLYEHWMKLGTFMAPFLLLAAFAFRDPDTPLFRDMKLLSLLMMVFYIAHQFEEHWIDLFGNLYAFQGFLNGTLKGVFGVGDPEIGFITKADIFVINTSVVWLVACIAIICSPKRIFPALCVAGVMLINAVSHSVSGVREFAYNPGLMTSLIIFIPFSIWFYSSVLKQNLASLSFVALSLGWAFFAHVILMVGLVLVNHSGVIPSIAYYVALVIWSIFPVFAKASLSERA